jgi:prepilin-type N-terminal cleavage/methylation domain-containing protein
MPSSRAGSPWHGRKSAFTLAEVLATMVLLTILLPVVMHGVSLSVQAADSARHSSQAAELAQSKLAELVTSSQLNGGTLSGDFSPEFPQYKWQSSAVSRDLGILEVGIEVSWDERGRNKTVDLTTWIYQTTTQ